MRSKIFDRFVEKPPVSVMARAAMEHAMAPEALDVLFVKHADKQCTRELLFSSVVDLMGSSSARSRRPFPRLRGGERRLDR